MSMPAIAFDTLEFAKELEAAGFTPAQAEGQARAQIKVISALTTDRLATKEDIKLVHNDIKHLEEKLEIRIKGLEKIFYGFAGLISTIMTLGFTAFGLLIKFH